MMKKHGKFAKCIILALLVTLLALSMTACSGSSTPGKSTDTVSNTNTSTSTSSSSSTPAAGGNQKTWKLKAGHVLGTEHPYQKALEKMKAELEKRSNGRITMDVYPSSQLGNERDLFEGCQMGTVDIGVGSTAPLANFNEEFTIFDLPYLFESREQAYRALDGDFGKEKFKKLEDDGMIGLTYFEAGYFDVLNSKHEVKTPEDMKGLKIRVMENKVFMAMIEAYGATAVPMAWSEVFTSIQNGAVDGTSNPIVTIGDSKLYTVAKYYTIAEPIYSPIPVIMSKATYDSMPADLQQLMRDVAKEATTFERDLVAQMEKSYLETMKSAGCTITVIADKEPWKKIMKEKVWPQFVGKTIKQEDIDKLNAYK